MAFTEVLLNLESTVTPTDELSPLTGVYSPSGLVKGWVWDRRLLPSIEFLQSRYDTFLGGHSVGLKDGTELTDWLSGSTGDLSYLNLVDYRYGDYLTWTPRISTGIYSLLFDSRPLFSDYSVSDIFDPLNLENGLMIYQLPSDALYETVHVVLYKRDELLRIFEHLKFQEVSVFTGKISGTSRLSTVDILGNIIPANIETRVYEYIINSTNDKLTLNNNYKLEIGSSDPLDFPTDYSNPTETVLEFKGAGKKKGRKIYTDYFPINQGSVTLISINSANTITTWTEVNNLNFSTSTDLHFSVDYDLGIITTGGFKAPNLYLSEDITALDTEIKVFLDEDSFKQYPPQGVINIGSEEIAYYSKGYTSFNNCTRGYNATIASAHSRGRKVSDNKHGKGTDDLFFVAYAAVPRIEYEVTSYAVRSANSSTWLDIYPLNNIDTNNILQILSADISLDQIVLEIDKPHIGGNLYGPLFFGTDTSVLTARALDFRDNPVDDIPLTIEIINGHGSLNGIDDQYTDITNSRGEIYAIYNNPYDKDSIEKVALSTAHVLGNTEMTFQELQNGMSVDDIWLFQVLKLDKFNGTIGLNRTITAAANVVTPYSESYIEINGLLDEYYRDGIVRILGTDSVIYTRVITQVFTFLDVSNQPYTRLYLKDFITPALVINQDCWILEKDAILWNAALLNGSRHILYEFNPVVIHPLTNLPGAYFPLKPDSISGNTLTFNSKLLPIPDPNNDSNNLGAYIIIVPEIVQLRAKGQDPATGRTVYSNRIRLSVELPQFLTGVDYTGVLPIPYGWKLVTEQFNIGAGIGGANFLTINAAASGLNQFSLTGLLTV